MSVFGLCGVAEQFYEALIASANLGIKTEKNQISLNDFQIYHFKRRFISLSIFIRTVINEIKWFWSSLQFLYSVMLGLGSR